MKGKSERSMRGRGPSRTLPKGPANELAGKVALPFGFPDIPAEASRRNDNYLRPSEAADYLGSALSTLAKLRVTGGGPVFLRLGKAIRYRKRDLDAWMASTAARSTSEYGDRS